ncbi:hypothetical protein BKA93DRAFT_148440 [Sparassis latifolia]
MTWRILSYSSGCPTDYHACSRLRVPRSQDRHSRYAYPQPRERSGSLHLTRIIILRGRAKYSSHTFARGWRGIGGSGNERCRRSPMLPGGDRAMLALSSTSISVTMYVGNICAASDTTSMPVRVLLRLVCKNVWLSSIKVRTNKDVAPTMPLLFYALLNVSPWGS